MPTSSSSSPTRFSPSVSCHSKSKRSGLDNAFISLQAVSAERRMVAKSMAVVPSTSISIDSIFNFIDYSLLTNNI